MKRSMLSINVMDIILIQIKFEKKIIRLIIVNSKIIMIFAMMGLTVNFQ